MMNGRSSAQDAQDAAAMVCTEVSDILSQAVAQKAPLKLAIVLSSGPCLVTARAMQLHQADGVEGIWLQLADEDALAIGRIAKELPACDASFCLNKQRYAFPTKLIKRDRHFWLND